MAGLNQCNFIGRLGRDPENRNTSSGTCVVNVSIACDERFKGKSGEWENRTEWVNLVFFGKLAEVVRDYCSKGQEIFVSGRLQTRKYQDRDGNDRYTTEVVGDKMLMLGGKGESGKSGGGGMGEGYGDGPGFDPDDSIPFLLPAHLRV